MAGPGESPAQVAARIRASLGVAEQAARATTEHYGVLLQARVRAKMSGRPGPRAITGDLRRSVTLDVAVHGRVVEAICGTNKPQGARLEWGFHGVDSLGRYYDQPPYPAWRPAVGELEPDYVDALRVSVSRSMKGGSV